MSTKISPVYEEGFEFYEDEQRLFRRSTEAMRHFERNGLLYRDQALENYLREVYVALLGEKTFPHLRLNVFVIHQKETNAFALPNGQLYISSAMLALMENEAQLATVLSHELTHVLDRHGLKVKRSTANKRTFFQSVSIIGPLASFAAISSISGYSRDLEHEADMEGFDRLHQAGYDIREAEKVYKHLLNFNQDEKIELPFFFSTHPALRKRIQNTRMILKEKELLDDMTRREDVFKSKTRELRFDVMDLWLQHGMFVSCERLLDRVEIEYPLHERSFYFRGELFRKRPDQSKFTKKKNKENDYLKALKAYDQALEVNQNYARAYKGKAETLMALDRNEEAKQAWERYLELAPRAKDKAFIQSLIEDME